MTRDAGGRVIGLDGLRAIAVIGVIASHSGLVGLGWLGVDVFFGLSGYLITGILLEARQPGVRARRYFVPFYMRRALRILPLAWAFVLLIATLRSEWSGVPWYLGYLVNWLPTSPAPTDLGHYWSLAVEEQFYLVWPAVVFLASPRVLLRLSLAVIAFNFSCRLGFSIWRPGWATDQWMGLATFARADSLLVGAILAQLERGRGWGRLSRLALPVVVVAGLGVVAIRALERSEALPVLTYNVKWPLVALGVGAGLLVVLVRKPKVLEWRWLVWIGQVSYGVYVIHAAFGRWLHSHFTLAQAPLMFAIQLGATLPLAALSWYLFESPILRWKRRWPMPSSRKASPPRGEPTAAALVAPRRDVKDR